MLRKFPVSLFPSATHPVLSGLEVGKISSDPTSVALDSCVPASSAIVPVDTLDAAGIIGAHLGALVVLDVGGGAEVAPAIVGPKSVDVIHLEFWPFPCHVYPSEYVGAVKGSIDAYLDVAGTVLTPSYRSFQTSTPCKVVVKEAGVGVVCKEFFKELLHSGVPCVVAGNYSMGCQS